MIRCRLVSNSGSSRIELLAVNPHSIKSKCGSGPETVPFTRQQNYNLSVKPRSAPGEKTSNITGFVLSGVSSVLICVHQLFLISAASNTDCRQVSGKPSLVWNVSSVSRTVRHRPGVSLPISNASKKANTATLKTGDPKVDAVAAHSAAPGFSGKLNARDGYWRKVCGFPESHCA